MAAASIGLESPVTPVNKAMRGPGTTIAHSVGVTFGSKPDWLATSKCGPQFIRLLPRPGLNGSQVWYPPTAKSPLNPSDEISACPVVRAASCRIRALYTYCKERNVTDGRAPWKGGAFRRV
jgi:hypothetical protein